MADTDKLAELFAARAEMNRAKKRAERLKAELIEEGIAGDGMVFFVDATGKKHRGYYSDSELVTFDMALLEELVGPEVWEQITTVRLDRDEVDRLMKLGIISKATIARTATISRERPTIRFDGSDGNDAALG